MAVERRWETAGRQPGELDAGEVLETRSDVPLEEGRASFRTPRAKGAMR